MSPLCIHSPPGKLRHGTVLLRVINRLQPDDLLGVGEASDVLRAYWIAVEPMETKTVNPEARGPVSSEANNQQRFFPSHALRYH
jgi:hypothetical protein